MQVCLYTDAATFLGVADPFFRSDPFSANVIAVVSDRLAAQRDADGGDELWATVETSSGEVVGVAMHTPPHALFVSRMPLAGAVALASAMRVATRHLPGVTGACEAARAFADDWVTHTGQSSAVITKMRMYRLGSLTPPRSVAGQAVLATSSHVSMVAEWIAAFHDEAQPHAPVQDWAAFATRRIAARQLHLWSDPAGTPVSLAGMTAPAAGVARVGGVYTHPAARRNGYGAAVTAKASAAALSRGAQHVVLYTDLANPTSNSIYQTIGYRPDHDAEEHAFR